MPFNRWPPGFHWSYLKFYLGNMLPAVAAIFISKFFQSVYAWRTVFLVNSSEDYVDVAKAKGMPDKMIERRYILRPLLPNIITNFVLIMIALWQESIILETIFSVAGIGQLFRAAIQGFDIRHDRCPGGDIRLHPGVHRLPAGYHLRPGRSAGEYGYWCPNPQNRQEGERVLLLVFERALAGGT